MNGWIIYSIVQQSLVHGQFCKRRIQQKCGNFIFFFEFVVGDHSFFSSTRQQNKQFHVLFAIVGEYKPMVALSNNIYRKAF